MHKSRPSLTQAFALAAGVCALATVLVVAGCSSKGTAVGPAQDRKAMMETAARWYVAEDAQDIKGIKAAVHDPGNILELATDTPAPSAEPTSAFSWTWDGSNIVMTAPSQETTITITNLSATPKNVDLYQLGGQGITVIMTKVGGAWKIDVAATQQAIDAAAQKASEQAPLEPVPGESP